MTKLARRPAADRKLFLGLACLALAACSRGHDELGHKDDYAFLQSTALSWQSASPDLGNLLVRDVDSDRCVVGVLGLDGRRVWILLNHTHDLVRSPDEDVSVDPEELSEILSFCEVSEPVREYLARRSERAPAPE